MNKFDRSIADTRAMLAMFANEDRFALAALNRGDDLALIRRLVRVNPSGVSLAVERALMRGGNHRQIQKAAGVTRVELEAIVAGMYAGMNPGVR